MRLDRKHLGFARIIPERDVVAGEVFSWVLEFRVGSYGIDDGGNIRFAWRKVSDGEQPQFTDPDDFGYTTVWTDGAADLRLVLEPFERPFSNSLRVNITNGYLREGDTVRVTIGDTSRGGPGIRAQSFCETKSEIKVLVDPFGTHRFFEFPEHLRLSVVSAGPNEIQVVVPATVTPDEEFEIVLRCLDIYGNPCSNFDGDIELSIPELDEREYCIAKHVPMRKADGGRIRIAGNKVYKAGSFHVKATCEQKGYRAYSNACISQSSSDLNLYFGDMHGQNNLTVGTGDLDEYFTFARDVGALDFAGWQGNDFEIDEDKWLQVRKKVKQYNNEHNFLVFLGYEWSGTTPTGGDHNVFFLNDSEDYYPSSNCLTLNKRIKPENNANPITELFDRFKGRDDVMLIPHIGGRHANLNFFNPEFMPAIEIHSHHGIFEWFAMDAMKRKLKTGFVASSDDHTCRLGLSYPLCRYGKKAHTAFDVRSGLVGVYAKDLTRESIWNGLKARRCYASTLDRVNLLVKAGEHYMGEEITVGSLPELYIRVAGTAPIEKIFIYNWEKVISEKCMLPSDKRKIKIIWGGVVRRARKKSANWQGALQVENGNIISAREICFDSSDQGIKMRTAKALTWTSSTSGDMDGLELVLDAKDDTLLHFSTAFKSFSIPVKNITDESIVYDAGGENLRVEVSLAPSVPEDEIDYLKTCVVELKEPLSESELSEDTNGIWVKVVQVDGNMAWSSPIFINRSQ